jgi:hypothetical protein
MDLAGADYPLRDRVQHAVLARRAIPRPPGFRDLTAEPGRVCDRASTT